MELSSEEIIQFQTKILSWYQKNKRDLPWREIPVGTSLEQKAYRILVSEVMLQQTQVSRVIPKYEAWIKRFPTVETLAKASVTEVLTQWVGLGYNRRALYLKKCAEALVELRIKNHELRNKKDISYWPQTEKELMRLPGIGKYTARALLCFAFNKQIAVVDTNIRKVIIVEFFKSSENSDYSVHKIPQKFRLSDTQTVRQTEFADHSAGEERYSEKDIEKIASLLLPRGKAYDWNQALMDYSSSVLKKEKIQLSKQSKYVGSDRFYRAKTLKLLLEEKRIPFEALGRKLRSDFSDQDTIWLEKIVVSLEKDGLVQRSDTFLTISH